MKKKILIDASHLEETRVAIINNDTIEDYEFQVKSKEELKGNIYLAKITKVEASLQAAFVDYGGKKQGFLPFNEINVHYFNLAPEVVEELKLKQIQYKESIKSKVSSRASYGKKMDSLNVILEEDITSLYTITEKGFIILNQKNEVPNEDNDISDEEDNSEFSEEDMVSQLESENLEYGSRFGYKIQDVIKPDQYLLVQVVKDERGNKGASVTTYLSIAGRYCVLMPSTPFEGGISKKITIPQDRQRLKSIIEGLEIPDNTNIIIRTASLERAEQEIIDDYHYVDSIWKSIQNQTKTMKKPGILFEEGILIKRVIRDLYSNNIEEIVIDGKEGFETAKTFAKLLAPDILKKITYFNHPKSSLFKYYKIDDEIKSIYSPVVFLKSGGYLVINITEALTAIDINSGKSKGRRNVEETALKTNLEACTEIAKQIKLRDLGGLIVIDFIDMENSKNRSVVEKKMKELSKDDKAKIQISPISTFGLLEISRQRIKTSLIERSFTVCPKCQGMGYTLPLELNALNILRSLISDSEKGKFKNNSSDRLIIKMHSQEAFYLLNNKRTYLSKLEESSKSSIKIECDDNIPYPFYIIEEQKAEEEVKESILFLERELEINANRSQEENSYEKNPRNNNRSKNNRQKNNNFKRNPNLKNSSKFNSFKKPEEKKGFLRKLLGL